MMAGLKAEPTVDLMGELRVVQMVAMRVET